MANILILDHEEDFRMLLKRLLERNGHKVFITSPNDDLSRRMQIESLNLVILTMGLKDSADLAGQLKRINRNIRVMTITNYLQGDAEPAILDDFLIKPVDIETIEMKVNELLSRITSDSI